MDPAVVTIQGPAQSVDAVEYAEVSLEHISPISQNLLVNMPFTLMDADGKKVVNELMTTSTDMVSVTFPVLKTKVIPLKLEMIDGGGLKQTQNIVATYEPSEITVAGDATALDVYNVCILGTVNLAEITSDTSATYSIVPPNGIECNSGEKEAKVTITIQGVNTKVYSVKPMATGFEAPPGYILNFVTKELSVTLRGAPAALNSISSYNIRPIVNLRGVTIQPDSQQIVDVSIEIDGTDDVGVVGEYTVVVEVVLQDPPTEPES
jgi:YbbR domain-containing protein